MSRPLPTERRDRGQAAVEFAIVLPLVVVLVLGIIQVVLVVRDQISIDLAARDGARAASVAASPPTAADSAAHLATRLRPISVSTEVGEGTVAVTVKHLSVTDVALLGVFIGDVELTATVTMAREPP